MSSASLACAMCGTVFVPHATSACETCPIGSGCSLACCPACGYSAVDVRRSRLGRLALRVAASLGGSRRTDGAAPAATLAEARSGDSVRVDRLEGLPLW